MLLRCMHDTQDLVWDDYLALSASYIADPIDDFFRRPSAAPGVAPPLPLPPSLLKIPEYLVLLS